MSEEQEEEKKEEIKKTASVKKEKKQSHLQYYFVKVQAMVPAEIEYKILANSPEEALSIYKKRDPCNIKYNMDGSDDSIEIDIDLAEPRDECERGLFRYMLCLKFWDALCLWFFTRVLKFHRRGIRSNRNSNTELAKKQK